MRRSLFGLLTLVAIAGLLLTTSCQRAATLRVVSINNGTTLRSDIADYVTYVNKDSEEIIMYQAEPDSVPVELQYVQIGAGLPTWTPYEALINKATIKYVGSTEAGIDYSTYATVVYPLTEYVSADPTATKTTKFWLTAVSGTMKDAVFSGSVTEPPEYNLIDLVTATVTFAGYDSVANQTVQAKGQFQIEFGNFYDDTTKFGK